MLVAFMAVATPLVVVASLASACGALASVGVSPEQATAGQTVTGTGKGFSNSHGGAPSGEPVVIRFNSRSGPALATVRPTVDGSITFSFKAPDVAPGRYVIVATQTNADGEPAPGTPARHPFEIVAAGARSTGAEVRAAANSSDRITDDQATATEPAPASGTPAPAPAATRSAARATTPVAPAPASAVDAQATTPAPAVAAEVAPAAAVEVPEAPTPAASATATGPEAPAAAPGDSARVTVGLVASRSLATLALALSALALALGLSAVASTLGRNRGPVPA